MLNSSNKFNIKIKYSFSVYFLALFIFLLPIDLALGDFIFGINLLDIVAAIYIVTSFLKRSFKLRNISFSPFIVFIIYVWFTMIWSNNIFNTSNIMFMIYTIFFSIAMIMKYDDKELCFLKKAAICSGIVFVICSLFFGINYVDGRTFIEILTLADPNFTTAKLTICVSFLISIILSMKKGFVLSLIYFSIIMVFVLLSGSRGSFVAIGIQILIAITITYKKKLHYLFAILCLCSIIYIFLLFSLPDHLSNRFNILEILMSTGSGRTTIWSNYIQLFEDLPAISKIFGIGRRNGILIYGELFGLERSSHNLFIEVLIDNGIIGLSLLLWTFVSLAWKSIKTNNITSLCLIIGFAATSMFLHQIDSRYIWITFLCIFYSLKKEKNQIRR